MLFTLEPLPAQEGDCLLLHWGTTAEPKVAVIDGGPGRVYDDTLYPRLDEILANRNLSQLPLELVMISHMDSDHIVGIKKLVRALKKQIQNHAPASERTLAMKRLWHNVFNDLLGDSIDQYYKKLTASYAASIGGQPTPQMVDELATAFSNRQNLPTADAVDDAWDVALVLAGHGEGRDVRDDHKFLFDQGQTTALNSPFKSSSGKPTLITAEMTPAPVKIAGLEFKIIGPLKAEIEALQKEFDDYIKSNGLSAQAVLAAYADRSIKNLSSIVCLVTLEGKRILLTGDARGDKILSGLAKASLLGADGTIDVDILKVPHHGSDRNVASDFFEKIRAKTYVFSGNGKHGNPDRDTLQWLVDARKKSDSYEIVLTYAVKETDDERSLDFQKKRKVWDRDKHSLAAFFEKTTNEGYAFALRAGAPVKVELGDEHVRW